MDHEANDAHNGNTVVVELDSMFGELSLLTKVVPAKVNVYVTKVVHELIASSLDTTPELEMRGRERMRYDDRRQDTQS